MIEIRARYPERIYPPTQAVLPPKIRVHRGAVGTTAASHLINAALEPVYIPSVGGGGEQTIRLVSVQMDADDPAWDGDPEWKKTIALLTPGQIVLDVWHTVTVGFTGAATGELMAGIDLAQSGTTLAVWELNTGASDQGLTWHSAGDPPDETDGVLSRSHTTPYTVTAATELAFVPSASPSPTDPGTAFLNALIAEPAA